MVLNKDVDMNGYHAVLSPSAEERTLRLHPPARSAGASVGAGSKAPTPSGVEAVSTVRDTKSRTNIREHAARR